MKHWVLAILFFGLPTAGLLLVAALLLPDLIDGKFLADRLLAESYRLPELVANYIPDLRRAVQSACLLGVSTAIAGFLIWSLAILARRPQGPGQVMGSWRTGLWVMLFCVVAACAYLGVYFVALSTVVEMIARSAANLLSAAIAALAVFCFVLLTLIGTERMIRPAIPGGALLVRSGV